MDLVKVHIAGVPHGTGRDLVWRALVAAGIDGVVNVVTFHRGTGSDARGSSALATFVTPQAAAAACARGSVVPWVEGWLGPPAPLVFSPARVPRHPFLFFRIIFIFPPLLFYTYIYIYTRMRIV